MSDKVETDWSTGIIDVLRERRDAMPDFLDIKKDGLQLVLAYGSLKKNFWNHSILSESDYLGQAVTINANFTMAESGLSGGFPIAFQHKTSSFETGNIKGEVYAVDPHTMLELDYLEANGSMYKREKKWVFLHDQTCKTKSGDEFYPSVQCWVYLGVEDYWRDIRMREMGMVKYKSNWVFYWLNRPSANPEVYTFAKSA